MAKAQPKSKVRARAQSYGQSMDFPAATVWKKQQKKYARSAKNLFDKMSDTMQLTKHYQVTAIENQKKKLASLKNAKIANETVQSLAGLQSQFVEDTLDDINAVTHGLMTRKLGQPVDFFMPLDLMRNSFHRAVEHAENVGSVFSQSRKEMYSQMNHRFEEAKQTMQSFARKSSRY